MNTARNPDKLSELKHKANRLPLEPGVYIMKDKSGGIIYIGKAKALKNRVTQYFGAGSGHTEKVRRMVSNVNDFEYIICDSEFEALILENSLIKQNRPKYNILLKDDKGYHYIKITNEKWRKIEATKQLDGNHEFIGPYYSAYVVKDTVDEVRKIFKLPDCNRTFDKPSKPCLNYHIGLCDAPCTGKMTYSQYNESVEAARDFIKRGDSAETLGKLNELMEDAAEKLDFEYAAKLRDRIAAIKKLRDKQKVVMCTYDSQDVFASALIGETACISVLIFRNGRLIDKQHFIIEGAGERAVLYEEFLQRYYAESDEIPPRLVFDAAPDNGELLCKWLSEKSGKKVTLTVPERGEQKALVAMCRNNAADELSSKIERSGREMSALNELATLLGLETVPRYIEAYDISNTAGDENVAGMIVYKDGRPYKNAYRRFKIKSFSGQDDFRSMAEVLDRRFNEYEKEDNGDFNTLPDLILLDGGKGQMSAVLPVLRKHNINVPLFGMVKDDKHRTRAVAALGGDISIKANRRAYTLVTEIQDEVHRFAIGYHKQRRNSKMLSSELTSIDGVGAARAKALLSHFKTVKAIKSASVEQLCEVKGMTKKVAKNIFNRFR